MLLKEVLILLAFVPNFEMFPNMSLEMFPNYILMIDKEYAYNEYSHKSYQPFFWPLLFHTTLTTVHTFTSIKYFRCNKCSQFRLISLVSHGVKVIRNRICIIWRHEETTRNLMSHEKLFVAYHCCCIKKETKEMVYIACVPHRLWYGVSQREGW